LKKIQLGSDDDIFKKFRQNAQILKFRLIQRATSLIHTSEIKMLLNFRLIILVLTIRMFRNVKTVIMLMIMLMVFLKQARVQ